MIKIRLARLGAKKRPFYKVVVADSRYPRNGRFIEKIGFFEPLLNSKNPQNISINTSRVTYWIKNGAILSQRVKKLIQINSATNKISEKSL